MAAKTNITASVAPDPVRKESTQNLRTLQPVLATQRFRTKDLILALQVSRTTLWRWSKLDGFPTPIKRGAIVLWDAKAIELWLEAGEVAL